MKGVMYEDVMNRWIFVGKMGEVKLIINRYEFIPDLDLGSATVGGHLHLHQHHRFLERHPQNHRDALSVLFR